MDTTEQKMMVQVAQFMRDRAKKDLANEVATIRQYLDDIERIAKRGDAPTSEVANMGHHVARLAEAIGRIETFNGLSEFVPTTKKEG